MNCHSCRKTWAVLFFFVSALPETTSPRQKSQLACRPRANGQYREDSVPIVSIHEMRSREADGVPLSRGERDCLRLPLHFWCVNIKTVVCLLQVLRCCRDFAPHSLHSANGRRPAHSPLRHAQTPDIFAQALNHTHVPVDTAQPPANMPASNWFACVSSRPSSPHGTGVQSQAIRMGGL